MRHKIDPYYTRVENGASYSDHFERDDFAENLTRLLLSTEDSLTLTINARWGEGKTTFIKNWERKLENDDNFIPIYFDAFENDFASDAFLSIAVTIENAVRSQYEKIGLDHEKKVLIENYKNNATDLGLQLAKMGVNFTLNLVTGGILQADSLIDFLIGKTEKLDKRENLALTDDRYDAFLNRKDTIRKYQNALESLLKLDANNSRNIIFFVDELDRCRPNFAIQVIEKIKHLFSVKGVNFVLAINQIQMSEIIKHSYGVSAEDAVMYLQKFVHAETNLPSLMDLRNSNSDKLKNYLIDLIEAFEIPSVFISQETWFELIKVTLPRFNYTPRSLERTLTLFTISTSSIRQEKIIRLKNSILLLCLFKIHKPPIFNDVKSNGNIRDKYGFDGFSFEMGSSFIKFLKSQKFFGDKVRQKASNVFIVEDLIEASKIVEMYDLPSEQTGDETNFKHHGDF